MMKQQYVGIRYPPILQQIKMDQQSVGIRDPLTLQISQNPIHINKGNSLIQENSMKLKTQGNRKPQKKQHNMEQLIQESLYFPEADQLTDQETMSRISKRVASIYPIGSPIDHSQTYHSGTEEEDQDTQIKSLLEEHQHAANISIGGRLTHFVDAWKLIGADALVTREIKAFWINIQALQILERNMINSVKIRSKDSQLALGKLIEKEFQEDIIEEVPFSQLKWINPSFAIAKSEPRKWRKIMDCSLLNKFLQATHFIMEDVSNLRSILQPKDQMIKIDLESAFHHIQVVKELRPFLGFSFNQKYFLYKAMCFGVKHAPLVFHKTLCSLIKFIREVIKVRIISQCDDIIFLHQYLEKLKKKKQQVINILTIFGWKISVNKSVLEPARVAEFLGWKIDSELDQISMTDHRQKKMIRMLGQQRRIVQNKRFVKVKFLASFLGSLNFLRLQIKRGGLYLKKLNKVKSWAVLT
ncbi:MAG: putative reverse transcriptase [Streblomastix strix]|uniref:Putative reverse transcriptase n=1 Tax=Streblomastix strix TaxID=222440 RepID=A0A5J4TVS4_9EUKA|nr:MAG: putative reverse transcriptase [Streblomastix strix]